VPVPLHAIDNPGSIAYILADWDPTAERKVILMGSGSEVTKQAARMIPGAQLVEIDQGPHGINVSHAGEFNAALLSFLMTL